MKKHKKLCAANCFFQRFISPALPFAYTILPQNANVHSCFFLRFLRNSAALCRRAFAQLSKNVKKREKTLLIDTKVILFDEATSALDNESQEYIKSTIDNLVKDHTIIIVAHRLSTIEDADVINVIDKGKLVESGTHRELLNNSVVYRSLYTREC